MEAPNPPTTSGHPSSHRGDGACTDERCILIRAERDELRRVLRIVEVAAHEGLSSSSTAAA